MDLSPHEKRNVVLVLVCIVVTSLKSQGLLSPSAISHLRDVVSSAHDLLLTWMVAVGIVGIVLEALRRHSSATPGPHRDLDSEPPAYSFRSRIPRLLPYLACIFGAAAILHEADSESPLHWAVLRTVGKVSAYLTLLLVPLGILWLLIKRLPLEPYKSIWRISTTVAPRVLIPPFLCLVILEGLSSYALPPPFPYLIQQAPRLSQGFKALGMGAYASVAVWQLTDATGAYLYSRAIAIMKLPVPRDTVFVPRSFVSPLIFPVAMIGNGCMYAAPSASKGFVSAIATVGWLTLQVAAFACCSFVVYARYFFLASSAHRNTPGRSRRTGWISRALDEMALAAFAFGSADTLREMQITRKRQL
ncbi:hypothetical protein FB451DRAFT_1211518 [Mycena latifolia]|nr:hypothetical protein FB451DRAFT_1211518 [Mycena latifolia]